MHLPSFYNHNLPVKGIGKGPVITVKDIDNLPVERTLEGRTSVRQGH